MTSLASVTAVMGNLGGMVTGAASWWEHGLHLIRWVAGIIVVGTLILGLYRFSPVTTLQFRSLMVGTGVAVVLFWLAKHGFAWYVQFAQASIPLYGALGAFLLFFLWLFYASLVFVVGAEAGWVFEHRRTLEGAGEHGMT
jgi:membrane protein